MIAYFILGIGLFVGTMFLARWYSRANPATVLKTIKIILAIIGLFIALFLLFTGRIFMVLAAIPLLLPMLLRTRALFSRLKAARGGTAGQSSEVVTTFLKMKLDHDSGEMDGLILAGDHKGCWLSELNLDQLEDLYRHYSAEEIKSAELLSAYASRRFGEKWAGNEDESAQQRDDADYGSKDNEAKNHMGHMDRKKALEILGLEGNPSPDEIRQAHRKLMQKLHPDHGGSTYLATQVNQAKEILLKGSG
ncbi:DnaJ domain-containing protein [Kiloniella litopenaei]|nr:DnaJ domain-containing protein [Kiloniella litopenaei]